MEDWLASTVHLSVLTSMTFPNASYSYHHCQHHQLVVEAVSGVRPGCQRQLPAEETTNFWCLSTQNKLCCLCCTRTGEWQSPWQPVVGELGGGDHEPAGNGFIHNTWTMTSSICSLCDQTWHCYHHSILALFPGLHHPQFWLFMIP